MRTVFFVFLLFIFSYLYPQPAATLTYDAVNNANQIKMHITALENLAETVQQSAMLEKTLDYFELAQKAISKISSVLYDVYYIESIVRRQFYIIESYSIYLNRASVYKHVSSSDLLYFTNTLEQLIKNSEQLLDLSTKFLKNDYFKMSDNERINALKDTDSRMSYIQTSLDIEMNRLETIERKGALYESLKMFGNES